VDEFAWLTRGFIVDRGPLADSLARAGKRKVLLLGCACARAVWHLLEDSRSRAAVEAAERFADGQAPEAECRQALTAAEQVFVDQRRRPPGTGPVERAAAEAARWAANVVGPLPNDRPWFSWAMSLAHATAVAHWAGTRVAGYRAGMQPVAADWDAARAIAPRLAACVFGSPSRHPSVDSAWLAWNGGTVAKLAEVIYTERRWGDLPVLADALEDGGCADTALLGHLRGPGPHARGCHALDLLLGRR
jgi:hypothetical protein